MGTKNVSTPRIRASQKFDELGGQQTLCSSLPVCRESPNVKQKQRILKHSVFTQQGEKKRTEKQQLFCSPKYDAGETGVPLNTILIIHEATYTRPITI